MGHYLQRRKNIGLILMCPCSISYQKMLGLRNVLVRIIETIKAYCISIGQLCATFPQNLSKYLVLCTFIKSDEARGFSLPSVHCILCPLAKLLIICMKCREISTLFLRILASKSVQKRTHENFIYICLKTTSLCTHDSCILLCKDDNALLHACIKVKAAVRMFSAGKK